MPKWKFRRRVYRVQWDTISFESALWMVVRDEEDRGGRILVKME